MGLTINNPVGGATLSTTATAKTTATSSTHFSLLHGNHHRQPLSLSLRKESHIVSATGKFTPRTGKFDSRNRRGVSTSTTTTKEEFKKNFNDDFEKDDVGFAEDSFVDDGFVVPELPGDKPDLWEGPQMDAVGIFVQYMWAFGVVFALGACGIAVATYNEGATDFKQTPAYKESIQSQDLLEGPGASDSDIFESNPTEEAPALE